MVDRPPSSLAALPYDSPLGPGQLRVRHGLDQSITIYIGPASWAEQLRSQALLVALLGIFSLGLAVLIFTLLTGQRGLPINPALLLLPMFLVWAVLGREFGLSFRNRSKPCLLSVSQGMFSFPYPLPRSRLESVPVLRVVRLEVETHRDRLVRQMRAALVVELAGGVTMRLLAGYPRHTLDQLCDLLGPELGLKSVDSPVASLDNRPEKEKEL